MKKLYFLLFIAFITTSSCRYMWGKRVRGNGNISTSERSVSAFKNVEVSGAIDLYVAQGETKPVRIETDANLLPYIEVQQDGERIEIKPREGVNLRPTGKIKVYVTSPNYHQIEVSGASNITGQTKIVNKEDLRMGVSGAGDIAMEVDAPSVAAEVSGAGTVNLKGQTRTFDLTLTGAAKAHCYDLLAENTKVEISGAGSADVYASVKMDADLSGAGSVRYKGGATSGSQQVSGAGSIKKVD
ncbi:MAG TPA: head GIN domain-containing protein [Chitinophagaceae bacterium]|nr:head GIN domain-containing protein [Chitinophagaceae bacterium]